MMSFDFDFAGPADWANAYRRMSLNVIPARKKHPLVKWREFQDALVPETIFEKWYGPSGEHARNWEMGFLTGKGCFYGDHGLLVIDVDAKEKDGPATWQSWLDVYENGLEPDTWKARTGSGGRHLYFRYPAHITIQNTQEKFHGIDTRAEGGFIMAPPSPHYVSGTHYEWEDGFNPLDVDSAEIADAPGWLIEICQDIGGRDNIETPRIERVEASGNFDAWGYRTDGREGYMRDVVWGRVVDLYREAPIKPTADDLQRHMLDAYEVYARNVRSRFPGDNEVGLEREGRGLSLFQVKWDVAVGQWDKKVAQAATVPKVEKARGYDGGEISREHTPKARGYDGGEISREHTPIVKPRIELIPWDDLPDVKVRWLIKDFLPAGGLAALFGKPGTYKSFVALYLAACVATGRDAFDRPTEQGDVIYIAGEGGAGLKRRRDAFMKHYALPPGTRVHFLRAQLNLRSTMDDAKALVDAIHALGLRPSLLIIDTLARAFAGGNENASEDMGAFVNVTTQIQHALDHPTILVVHHSGKDESRGMRGHSSFFGAIDTELEVVKLSDDSSPIRVGQMTVTKQKDGEDDYKIGYRLEYVQLGQLDPSDGSLVVVPDDAPAAPKKKPLSPENKRVLAALEAAIGDAGTQVGLERVPRGALCVKLSLWRETYVSQAVGERTSKERVFRRAAKSLQESGQVGHHADYCWISDA